MTFVSVRSFISTGSWLLSESARILNYVYIYLLQQQSHELQRLEYQHKKQPQGRDSPFET
jgi:hypothetical protein